MSRLTRCHRRLGFTLIESMVGASIVAIVLVAMAGSFYSQSQLNAHARNLTAAMNDASRVLEQIRLQNLSGRPGSTCDDTPPLPSARPPAPYTSWNAWLNTGAPGAPKSINEPDRDRYEVVAVTCRDENGGSADTDYCGVNQVGGGEWRAFAGTTAFEPIRVTVAVGWRQGQRVYGGTTTGQEFSLSGGATVNTTSGKLVTRTSRDFTAGPDRDGDGVIESHAMLTTLVSCR
jgi:prepilin-type N-terminal cleavage/methylation domain-containing protein